MKKILCFFLVFVAVLLTVCAAKANVCLLSGEGGASNNCDSGTSQAGLPVHDPRTISKKGTKLTLCNNVNRFSYCPQALEYSKSHEFDYVKRGAQEYGRNASIGCPEEEDEGTNCYIPTCKYVNEASCKSAEGADCCKSILNGECWHKCDICRFNMIGDSYYPYADDSIKDCKLVDRDNFFSRNLIYTPKNKGFRVTKLQNIEKGCLVF